MTRIRQSLTPKIFAALGGRRAFALVIACCACLAHAQATEAPKPVAGVCPANVLGTSRTLTLGTQGGFAIGLKTYPHSLDLADHEVVLTFDDGPSPSTTPKLLDALARQCVHATFFLIGRNAAAYPALVKREIAQGETVGHHTFSHPGETLRLMSNEAARADIDKGFAADDEAAYGKVDYTRDSTGKSEPRPRVGFFRFPGFADTPQLDAWLRSRNIGIFGVDLWASDWLELTSSAELDMIMTRLDKEGRGVLLLHDSRRSTALMLPRLLIELRMHGYRVVHLVPGAGPPPKLRAAPQGWTSETEAILAKMTPLLKKEAGRSALKTKTRSDMSEPGL